MKTKTEVNLEYKNCKGFQKNACPSDCILVGVKQKEGKEAGAG